MLGVKKAETWPFPVLRAKLQIHTQKSDISRIKIFHYMNI